MSLQQTILGFLHWRPMTGYDLKKLFAATPVLYWSGNNNQIYRTLVQLHQEGMVSQEIEYQADNPPRKVYTLTAKGVESLRQAATVTPDLPQLRQPLLIHLLWADIVTTAELDDLLGRYEEELRVEWLMERERIERQLVAPQRTPREALLWRMVNDNWLTFYEGQLQWLRELRQAMAELP